MAKTPQVGEPAPDFELPGTDGPFRLSEYRGERIVLGGGSRSTKVIAAPAILLKLPNAEIVEGLANPIADAQ